VLVEPELDALGRDRGVVAAMDAEVLLGLLLELFGAHHEQKIHVLLVVDDWDEAE
jgi:hypothetical protein